MFGITSPDGITSAVQKGPSNDLRFLASDGSEIVTFTGDGKIIVPSGIDFDYAAQQFLLAVEMATGRTLVIRDKES